MFIGARFGVLWLLLRCLLLAVDLLFLIVVGSLVFGLGYCVSPIVLVTCLVMFG